MTEEVMAEEAQRTKEYNGRYPTNITNWEIVNAMQESAKVTSDDTWETIEKWIPYVKRVFMTGGEPTIIKRNLDYIDKIIESNYAKEVELIFTTNATNINQKFIEKSKQFKSVSFNVSIDAVGELANYIRNPSDWKTIESNMQKLYAAGMGVSFNTTIQWLNMTRLNEIFSYLKSSYIL